MNEINGQPRQAEVRKVNKTAEWIHEIQKLESVVVRNHVEALQAAYRIGLMLIDLRETMNAGEWEPFLAEHLSYSRQRASRYARIAKYWEEVLNSDSISEALERITEIKGRDKEGYGTARRVPDQEGRKSPAKPKEPRKPKATPAGSDGAHTTTPEVEALLDRFEELFNMTSGGALFTLRKILQEYGREPPKRN